MDQKTQAPLPIPPAPATVRITQASISSDSMEPPQLVANVIAEVTMLPHEELEAGYPKLRIKNLADEPVTEETMVLNGVTCLYEVFGVGAGLLQAGNLYSIQVLIQYSRTIEGLENSDAVVRPAPE